MNEESLIKEIRITLETIVRTARALQSESNCDGMRHVIEEAETGLNQIRFFMKTRKEDD